MAETQAAPTIEPTEPQPGAERPLSLLAKEAFGSEFKGEVKTPETPVETEEPEETETPEDASSEEPVETEETPAEESGTSEEIPISSLTELTEHEGWDSDWVNALKVPVKVDGTPAEATLSDLVANYQMNAAADKRLEETKVKTKAQTEELRVKSEVLDGQFATVAKLIENVEGVINQEVQSIDLSALRESDPAEYAAKVAETNERRMSVDAMKKEAVAAYQQSTAEQQKNQQEELGKYIAAEQSALLEKLPEWRDQKTAKDEGEKLSKFLLSQGFSDQDIATAYDHKLVLIARKAMLFDEGQTKVATAKKKVAKVPKVMKPGTPKPPEQANKERVDTQRARLRKSGSIDDAFALLKAKRGG